MPGGRHASPGSDGGVELTVALLTLLGLALACTATTAAILVVPIGGPARRAWMAAALGVSALAIAALSGTTSLLDLPAIAGVALFGGIAGAGWDPPIKRTLLVCGSICFSAATLARLLAFSHAAIDLGGEAVAGISLTWATARPLASSLSLPQPGP